VEYHDIEEVTVEVTTETLVIGMNLEAVIVEAVTVVIVEVIAVGELVMPLYKYEVEVMVAKYVIQFA